MKILLNDLLNFSDNDLKRAKVKLNKWNGINDPIEVYKSNPENRRCFRSDEGTL